MCQKGSMMIKHTQDYKNLCHSASWARGPSFGKKPPEHEIVICVLQQHFGVLEERSFIGRAGREKQRKMHNKASLALHLWTLEGRKLRGGGGGTKESQHLRWAFKGFSGTSQLHTHGLPTGWHLQLMCPLTPSLSEHKAATPLVSMKAWALYI